MKTYRCFLFITLVVNSLCLAQSYQTILQSGPQTPPDNLPCDDRVYDPKIRTVQLYVDERTMRSFAGSMPPVLALGDNRPLMLEFDELGADIARNFTVKIIHCNFDWKPSDFSYMEYLSGFNETLITDFEFSSSTKVPYVHYKIQLPSPKISGNYLAQVLDSDQKTTVLTRRFVLFEPLTRIAAQYNLAIGGLQAQQFQQIDVVVSHPAIDFFNPQENVKLLIRQNYRWDNARVLKPLFVKSAERVLDYRYFDLKNAFPGGNEFRVADISDFESNTFGVADRIIENPINTMILFAGHLQGNLGYSGLVEDLNGRFIPQRSRFLRPATEADYTQVIFTLLADEPLPNPVHVLGGFNAYQPQEENRMVYQPEQKRYIANLLLKQGYYNYFFAEVDSEGHILTQRTENNFELTENEYDILVYYTPFGGRGDRVLGYTQLRVHQRR